MTVLGAGLAAVAAPVVLAAERQVAWESVVAAVAAMAAAWLTYLARREAHRATAMAAVIEGYDELVRNLQASVGGLRQELTHTRTELREAREEATLARAEAAVCEARSAAQAERIAALEDRLREAGIA